MTLATARTVGATVCTSAVAGTASVIGRFSFVSVSPDGHACEVATLTTTRSVVAETTVPESVSENGVPGFAANSSLYAFCRYGYGLTACPPPGCTSKCRCELPPSASPESPTYAICCPAATRAPFFTVYAIPLTHLPRLSFFSVKSLFRWM